MNSRDSIGNRIARGCLLVFGSAYLYLAGMLLWDHIFSRQAEITPQLGLLSAFVLPLGILGLTSPLLFPLGALLGVVLSTLASEHGPIFGPVLAFVVGGGACIVFTLVLPVPFGGQLITKPGMALSYPLWGFGALACAIYTLHEALHDAA